MEGGAWQTRGDSVGLTPRDCYTVGWVVKDDDSCMVLVHTIGNDDDEDVGGLICIPRGMVVSVTSLDLSLASQPVMYPVEVDKAFDTTVYSTSLEDRT